jgi:lipase chaperone LimK
MAGTTPDGRLASAGDALVVDAELARLFDYYLAGQGETSLAEIRAATERELERRLKPGEAAQAKRLLDQYWRYKEALVTLEPSLAPASGMAAALRQRMAARAELRGQFFSFAEMQGLFGVDDAYDADAVTRLEIKQDRALTEAQRRARLAALDAAQSPTLREHREAPRRILALAEQAERMRASGAGDDEVYRMRAAAISPEAANRLADLDREEADWSRRIALYQQQRRAILQGPTAAQGAAQEQLRQLLFSADEQRRLAAYELADTQPNR